MRCNDVRERLLPFVDGALAPDEARELEAHAADCEACGAELERTRRLAACLAAAPEPAPVDVDVAWLAFHQRLQAAEPRVEPRAWWRRWWLVPVPVAAVAGAALAVAWLAGAPREPDEVRLVQALDVLEELDCLVELPTLEAAGLLGDPSEIERALEEVGG